MRKKIEKLVTKQDYFHLPHKAEYSFNDPKTSYYYDVRQRIYYPYGFSNNLPAIQKGNLSYNNPVNAAQYGLGFLQNYWDTGKKEYLTKAKQVANSLLRIGEENEVSYVWKYPIEFRGCTNWLSAMAQGQVASLLLRIGTLYSEEYYLGKARKALQPFFEDIQNGGVSTFLNNCIWFEEYCVNPVPFTLNGYIVAILGIRDAAKILRENKYEKIWLNAKQSLIVNLDLFDYYGWSKYCLSGKHIMGLKLRNLASPFYQRFHVELLKIMNRLHSDKKFEHYIKRWQTAILKGPIFYTAITEKIIYRLIP